jgi:hypothetical protein
MKSSNFWDITACIPQRVSQSFGGPSAANIRGQQAHSSTLRPEAARSSGTCADVQKTVRRYVPEDKTRHNPFQFLIVSYDKIYREFKHKSYLTYSWKLQNIASIRDLLHQNHVWFISLSVTRHSHDNGSMTIYWTCWLLNKYYHDVTGSHYKTEISHIVIKTNVKRFRRFGCVKIRFVRFL